MTWRKFYDGIRYPYLIIMIPAFIGLLNNYNKIQYSLESVNLPLASIILIVFCALVVYSIADVLFSFTKSVVFLTSFIAAFLLSIYYYFNLYILYDTCTCKAVIAVLSIKNNFILFLGTAIFYLIIYLSSLKFNHAHSVRQSF
jgi:hypothetical protein